MQEDIENRSVTLIINTAKLTARNRRRFMTSCQKHDKILKSYVAFHMSAGYYK